MKKRMLCSALTGFFLLGTLPVETFAAEKAAWQENKPDIHIAMTDFRGFYDISYLDASSGQFFSDYVQAIQNGVYVLMIDGGFVPTPKVLLQEDGTVCVPFSVLEKPLGLVLQQDTSAVILQRQDGRKLPLSQEDGGVTWVGDEIYVRLRQVAAYFGCEVGYVADYGKEFLLQPESPHHPKIRIISIETPQPKQPAYFNKGAAAILQEMSATGIDGGDFVIVDTGKAIGRYDVFVMKGFEGLPVFFNRYTGEVYCANNYSPLLSLESGLGPIHRAK